MPSPSRRYARGSPSPRRGGGAEGRTDDGPGGRGSPGPAGRSRRGAASSSSASASPSRSPSASRSRRRAESGAEASPPPSGRKAKAKSDVASNAKAKEKGTGRPSPVLPPRGAIPLDDRGMEDADAFFAAAKSPASPPGTAAAGSPSPSKSYGRRAERARERERREEDRRARRGEAEAEGGRNVARGPDALRRRDEGGGEEEGEGRPSSHRPTPRQAGWTNRSLHRAMGVPTADSPASPSQATVLSGVTTAAPSTRGSVDTIATRAETRHALREGQGRVLLDGLARGAASPPEEGEEEEEEEAAGPVDPPEEDDGGRRDDGDRRERRGVDPEERDDLLEPEDGDGDGEEEGGRRERGEEEEASAKRSHDSDATVPLPEDAEVKAKASARSAASAKSGGTDSLEGSLEELVDFDGGGGNDDFDDDDDGGEGGGMQLAAQQEEEGGVEDEADFGGGGGDDDGGFDDANDGAANDAESHAASQRSRTSDGSGASRKSDDGGDESLASRKPPPPEFDSEGEEEEPPRKKKSKKDRQTSVTPTSVLRTEKSKKKKKKKGPNDRAKKVNFSTPSGHSRDPAGNREYEEIPASELRETYPRGEEPRTPGGKRSLRRSKRARHEPLQFWKNEKFLYAAHKETGLLGEAMGDMPVVAGVIRALPTPQKPPRKRKENDDDEDYGSKKKKGKKGPGRPRKDDDGEGSDDESTKTPFDDRALRRKRRIRDGETGSVWSETLEAASEVKLVSRLDARTFSKLPLSVDRGKRESRVVGFASQAFHVHTDDDDLFPGYIAGNVVIPPRGIKDAEGVGLCSQVFNVGDCQPGSVEFALADPGGKDGEFDPRTAQRYLLSRGDMFQIPPGNVYRIENHSKTRKADLFWTIVKCTSRAEQDDSDEEDEDH